MPNYTKAKRNAKKKRNVLFVSAEVAPFTSGSDLADITNGLPLALEELGNEMRIMMPKYGSINDRVYRIHDVLRLKELTIPFGDETKKLDVKVTALPASKTQTYFLYNEEFFKRTGLYADAATQKEYPDNDKRFIFFSRGVFETLRALGWKPDIIHCNDWISGLTVVYLKTIYKEDPFFKDIKCIFTIHNIDTNISLKKKSLIHTGIPKESFPFSGNEISFMDMGISMADIVTTLSPTYASDIMSSSFGGTLAKFLKKLKKTPIGITNGINTFSWNPEKDKALKRRFTYDTVTVAKRDNKMSLYQKVGFSPLETDIPLIAIVSELKSRKGLDLIIKAFTALMKQDIKMVVVGSGDTKYETFFKKASEHYDHKFKFYLNVPDELKRQIFGATDIFVMPSLVEPCGINHMRAMRYGALPIVRETGGLIDTTSPISKKGAAFTFTNFDKEELMACVLKALELYQDKNEWKKLVKIAMSRDFSWLASAKQYDEIYEQLTHTTLTAGFLSFGKYTDVTNNTFTIKGYVRFSYFFNSGSLETPISSELRLNSAYSPTPSSSLRFDIYRVDKPTKLLKIRLNSNLIVAEKLNTEPISISTNDTLTAKIIPLPFSYTKQLFDAIKKGTGYYSGDSSTVALMLVPIDGNAIIKINTLRSKLAFEYDEKTASGIERKKVIMSLTNVAFTSSQTKLDYASDITSGLFISSGISNFANLHFNLSSIPANSHILSATLKLHEDTLNSKTWTTIRSPYEGHLSKNGTFSPLLDNLSLDSYSAYSYYDSTATKPKTIVKNGRTQFNIAPFIQKWINKPTENFGMSLRPSNLVSQFQVIKFYYRSAPIDTLLPTLTISYTKLE
ncbi:hypothetical protein CHS0354_000631 [Potamilus streckersoni]|uniref:starch synthase n=1 Tax=Potamilus streckersoni TaxID=2493646 RepID=A0AAE0W943_9BIVA|nr:hypothetical protein CHS0354_000631 [Potamilus streckersoni]